MAKKEVTSKKVASKAAKMLVSPNSSKAVKTVAGSVLSQRAAPNKKTSSATASAASKVLKSPTASKASKSVAGSALTQKSDKGTNSGGPRRPKK